MSASKHEFKPEQLIAYKGSSFELIPLHSPTAIGKRGQSLGKAPCQTSWRLMPSLSIEDAQTHMLSGRNVGVRLRSDQLVVDVDPRNGGQASFIKLVEDIGCDLSDFPTVETGGGGQHVYMMKPADTTVVTTLEAYPGIDFKSVGSQVVAPGSSHPTTRRSYKWDALSVPLGTVMAAPERLLSIIERQSAPYQLDEGGKRSPDDLAELLEPLQPDNFREQAKWFEIMAACHHATSGIGRQEFIDWSIGDPTYADHSDTIGRRWDSLSCDNKRLSITEATLFKALHAVGRGDVVNRVTARSEFDEVGKEDATSSDVEITSDQSKLKDAYVWIVDAECFVRRADTKRFTAQQFKSFHADRWQKGDILNAVWRSDLAIPKLESMIYLPGAPEFTNDRGRGEVYNLWRDRRVVPKPGDVSIFLEHLEYMFPDEAERAHALDYLALLIQKPADKINFALLVRGRQGTGKSWLGSLVGKMIGEDNVTRPSNSVVAEKYTGWQEGAQIAIIEELMALGRQEVANRLKPVITDDYLCIRALYRTAYNLPNRLNLICFTNHADSLPIEAGDRRWLVLFSPAEPAGEAYYDRLFAFLQKDGPAYVANWLSQREVMLKPRGVAPLTRGKVEMRGLSLGEAEQHLQELWSSKAQPFDLELVRVEDLIEAVPDRIARQTRGLKNRVVGWLQDEVRAAKLPRYTKGDRPAYQLWSIANHDHWRERGAAACCDAYLEHHRQM